MLDRPRTPGGSPPPEPAHGAPFALAIATKQDPAQASPDEQEPVEEHIAILDASGPFSLVGAVAIAAEIDKQFAAGCSACIVRFSGIDVVDREALATFARCIHGHSEGNRDVRISADQAEVWTALAAFPDLQHVLSALGDTAESGHRRQVQARHPG